MNCEKGIALYEKAKKLIPGGTQLLSKRPEMFLPGQWPSYYSKCKGVEVWDLDSNKYIDMTISGVGACILGYADPEVDAAVIEVVRNGNMCTLNVPEEVELAELLCELHPWAEMVRFARGGGDAMAISVRIARASNGRDKIAFCGYHGWHDWYLSANLADDKNLEGQLLPGLEPAGVPKGLRGSALPFSYNNTEALDKLITDHGNSIAAIVMEPVRHNEPEKGFLEYVREAADKINAVLIFDEVTSGWRMNTGGIHMLYGVTPDIAVFAKGMSNGYPMAAVIGRRSVMEAAQKSFISSTYWTERIGTVAALTAIRKMITHKAPEHLCRIGNLVRAVWREEAKTNGLKIKVHGIPPLSILAFDYAEKSQAVHTLFTQEMLEKGVLASKAFYSTYSHKEEHISIYREAVNGAFKTISKSIEDNSVDKLLKGPVAHTGFKRLA